MPNFYRPLINWLNLSKEHSYPINPSFSHLSQIIEPMCRIRPSSQEVQDMPGFLTYSQGGLIDLRDAAKAHIEKFKQPIVGFDSLLVLTHPLFYFLSEWDSIGSRSPEARKDSFTFKRQFKRSLIKAKENGIGVVLLETPEHYAAATSKLLEDKLVQHVILTKYARGEPLEESDLDVLSDAERLFMGGSYSMQCFYSSLTRISNLVGADKLYLMPQLIFYPPGQGLYLDDEVDQLQRLKKMNGISQSLLWYHDIWHMLKFASTYCSIDQMIGRSKIIFDNPRFKDDSGKSTLHTKKGLHMLRIEEGQDFAAIIEMIIKLTQQE